MVGMARPKKQKVEAAVEVAETSNGTSGAGEEEQLLEKSSEVAETGGDLPLRLQKKLEKAQEELVQATLWANKLRKLANEHEAKQKLAQRLHDAKQARLAAGDKLKRRKNTFGAARRGYEAIIELLEVKHQCEWYRCCAAEAETAAARAEIRLLELA